MSATNAFLVVGKSPQRIERVEKVTRPAKFTGDLEFAGLLEAKVLRSPFSHAIVESIDASRDGDRNQKRITSRRKRAVW